MIGSSCQPRWLPEANYLRAIEGFMQSAPQLVLQIVIVCKGTLIHSFRDLLRAVLEDGITWDFFNGENKGLWCTLPQ